MTIRTLVNVPGVSFDAGKTDVFFAEDYNELAGNVASKGLLISKPRGMASVLYGGWDGFADSFGTEYSAGPIGNLIPFDGVIKNFYFSTNENSLDAGETVATVCINGVATDITITIPFGETGTYSDLVHTANVSAGDFVQIRVTVGGTEGELYFAFSYLVV